MKLGIVGAGLIVKTLFEFLDEVKEIQVVAICGTEVDRENMQKFAVEHHIAKQYYDYDQFLADEEIEVVYMGVPNFLHYRFGKKALLANKNVIMEKPFTTNYNQACNLAKIANEKGLMIVEAISNQYNPNYLKIKELVPTIGDVKIVSLNYTQYSSRYDAFKQGNILPAFDRKKSGGALMDLNIYNIHYIVGLFGLPTKVSYHPNMEKEIDTSGILTLDYPTFQAVLIAAKDCASPFVNAIQGDKGCIYTSSPLFTLTHFDYQLNNQPSIHYDYTADAHRMQHEFVRFVEVFDQKQMDFAQERLQHSLDVMKVLTEARQTAGIVFPDDENI